ncbi:Ada metal-binding domain-containing protein [Bradyrhizobium betae]
MATPCPTSPHATKPPAAARRCDGWRHLRRRSRLTGIYCRPVCPAKTPLARNVKDSIAAQPRPSMHGFRALSGGAAPRRLHSPVRPGKAPERPSNARCLLIEDGELDRGGVDRLAARLGVGTRHLTPPLRPASRSFTADKWRCRCRVQARQAPGWTPPNLRSMPLQNAAAFQARDA